MRSRALLLALVALSACSAPDAAAWLTRHPELEKRVFRVRVLVGGEPLEEAHLDFTGGDAEPVEWECGIGLEDYCKAPDPHEVHDATASTDAAGFAEVRLTDDQAVVEVTGAGVGEGDFAHLRAGEDAVIRIDLLALGMTVIDDRGAPIRGASVVIVPESRTKGLAAERCSRSQRTDEAGRVRFEALRARTRYVVSVKASRFSPCVLDVVPNGSPLAVAMNESP